MANQVPLALASVLQFGPYRLFPAQKLLLEGDRPVRLGSRALEILILLAERAGHLVERDELISYVWPNTFVEESSLRVHVAALRRVLGDGQTGRRYIANIPGRGYQFVEVVSRSHEPGTQASRSETDLTKHLPLPLARIVGRDEIVCSLAAQVLQSRFVTIVGPGGIGKTTIALAIADRLSQSLTDGVRFVDLTLVSAPQSVAAALATALSLSIRSNYPLSSIVAFLAKKRMLVVLDSCEHLVEEAATLAEVLHAESPEIHILVTSREPLRAAGERVHRLSPLELPASTIGLSAAEALAFPAIQLFVERAAASLDGFVLSDVDAPLVADICRRLDGIPLAIELVAGRMDVFGVAGLAELLNDRFRLLLRGRRTAMPRHQTLRAAFDWSYTLLTEAERVVFRRFSVFAGGATMESVGAVAAMGEISHLGVFEIVTNLVEKSLIIADLAGAAPRYRLLETTRAYAREKLMESGEVERCARSHAEHYRSLFERSEFEWATRTTEEWIAAYGGDIDNMRAALDWAFSQGGEGSIGIALTVASEPLWTHLSLIDEFRGRIEQALTHLASETRGTRRHMQLLSGLGSALLYANDSAHRNMSDIAAAWTGALEIAEKLDDVEYRLKALWGLWIDHFNRGAHRSALEIARKFRTLAANSSEPSDLAVGNRMIGFSLQLLGELADARDHIERMLGSYVPPTRRSHTIRFQFDQRVTAKITLAQVRWLEGYPDQALDIVKSGVAEAIALDHSMSLCNILAQAACPIAFLTGKLAEAERFIKLLLENAVKHSFRAWQTWGRCYEGQLIARLGNPVAGVEQFHSAFNELSPERFALRYTAFLGELAELLCHTGQIALSKATIESAIKRSRSNEELWCIAELLRIQSRIVLEEKTGDAARVAQQHLIESLNWARRQGALSWEIRTATCLAQQWQSQGRKEDARDLLSPIYSRFQEGFATTDLVVAREILETLE